MTVPTNREFTSQMSDHLLPPLERFIRDEITPQHADMSLRTNVFSHRAMMLGAARALGIKVRKITTDHFVFHHKGEIIGGFDGRSTTLASHHARKVTQSLPLTRRHLTAAGISMPTSAVFSLTQYEAALEHFRSQTGEVVVSSEHKHSEYVARMGTSSEEEFARIWAHEEKLLSSRESSFQRILLTTVRPGIVLRVLTVGERVAAAVARVPLYVVGDGTKTVDQLVSAEIERRTVCKYLTHRQPIVDDDFLSTLPVSPGTVLPQGCIQRLSSSVQGNADGRIGVDVTDVLAQETAELAVDAMWAIPGLGVAAVDLIVDSPNSRETPEILSVSAAPDVAEFRYPAFGTHRQANRAVLRHMIEQSQRTSR